ncbi:MAG TPA: hypothetical protein VGN52_08685 [Burkholderiales bacterium]
MSTLSLSQRLGLLATAGTAAFAFAGVPVSAHAAGKAGTSEAQAQYKRDLADCDSNKATEARATCRTEAQRAFAQAKAGDLPSGSAETFARNERQRCDALKGVDRTACIERADGRGTTSGSVSGGGILRESTVTVPAGQ